MYRACHPLLLVLSTAFIATGCVRVQTEPIRIEPIYIEITINHRIQKELDEVFAEIDQASASSSYAPLKEDNPEIP